MADPVTALIIKKIAVAVASDKRTWKVVASVIIGFLMLIILPLFLIMSISSGGAESNKNIADIVFNGGEVPSDLSNEYKEYVEEIKLVFEKLDIEIESINTKITPESLDDIRIKAIFYGLYFGKNLTFTETFYKDFINCFVETTTENEVEKTVPIKDLAKVYENIATLIGKEITETEKTNIDNLYFQMKFGYVVGGENGGNASNNGIPSEALEDEIFATLMAEATRFLGMPYIWGGSKPSESFDCSGFVCWSFTASGVKNVPRTTAQGLYNQSTLVSKSELKPGDLVFFTKTYKSSNPVTHVGIYIGDDKMIHAGDPIGYADLNNSYYKSHFYAYGRL